MMVSDGGEGGGARVRRSWPFCGWRWTWVGRGGFVEWRIPNGALFVLVVLFSWLTVFSLGCVEFLNERMNE